MAKDYSINGIRKIYEGISEGSNYNNKHKSKKTSKIRESIELGLPVEVVYDSEGNPLKVEELIGENGELQIIDLFDENGEKIEVKDLFEVIESSDSDSSESPDLYDLTGFLNDKHEDADPKDTDSDETLIVISIKDAEDMTDEFDKPVTEDVTLEADSDGNITVKSDEIVNDPTDVKSISSEEILESYVELETSKTLDEEETLDNVVVLEEVEDEIDPEKVTIVEVSSEEDALIVAKELLEYLNLVVKGKRNESRNYLRTHGSKVYEKAHHLKANRKSFVYEKTLVRPTGEVTVLRAVKPNKVSLAESVNSYNHKMVNESVKKHKARMVENASRISRTHSAITKLESALRGLGLNLPKSTLAKLVNESNDFGALELIETQILAIARAHVPDVTVSVSTVSDTPAITLSSASLALNDEYLAISTEFTAIHPEYYVDAYCYTTEGGMTMVDFYLTETTSNADTTLSLDIPNFSELSNPDTLTPNVNLNGFQTVTVPPERQANSQFSKPDSSFIEPQTTINGLGESAMIPVPNAFSSKEVISASRIKKDDLLLESATGTVFKALSDSVITESGDYKVSTTVIATKSKDVNLGKSEAVLKPKASFTVLG